MALAPVGRKGAERRLIFIVAAIGALLGIAVFKPWNPATGPPPPGLPPPGLPPPGLPPPSARPSIAAIGASSPTAALIHPASTTAIVVPSAAPGLGDPGGQCAPGIAWRIFAIERTPIGRVLTWYAVEPARVGDARDSASPTVLIVATEVDAVGFCAAAADATARPAGVQGWRVPASGAPAPIVLRPLADYAPVNSGAGAVYAAPDTGGAEGTVGWPDGTYLIAVPLGSDRAEWRSFAVRIVLTRTP